MKVFSFQDVASDYLNSPEYYAVISAGAEIVVDP